MAREGGIGGGDFAPQSGFESGRPVDQSRGCHGYIGVFGRAAAARQVPFGIVVIGEPAVSDVRSDADDRVPDGLIRAGDRKAAGSLAGRVLAAEQHAQLVATRMPSFAALHAALRST